MSTANMKPMYTTSIVQVKSGETIPPTLLQKLLQENQTAIGLVVREPDKLVVEKFPKLKSVEETATFLANISEGMKKYPRMICFHSYPAEHDEDEIMPWIVLKDSKGNPLLVIAIEGDFPNHVNNEYSEAYNLLDNWLAPKITDMFKLLGNSPQKLFEYLHSAQFQSDFKNVLGHRGVIGFMPTVGDQFIIESNEIGVSGGTWGSASNAYGYTESAIAAATPVTTEIVPAVRKSKYASDAPAEPPKPEVKPPQADPAPAKIPEEKVAASLQPEEIDWTPPQGLHGKPLKAAYRAVNNDVLPVDWRERPTIRIKVTKKPTAAAKAETTGAKDMRKVEPQQPESKVLTMPVISGPQQGKAVDFIKKYIGDGSAVIDDPVRAQEQEQKLAVFSELVLKTGKLDEINRWTTAFIFAFVKENPETGALAFIELRRKLRLAQESLAAGDKTLGELTGEKPTETKPAPGVVTAPPASPAPIVEQPTIRKSKYA